MSLAVAGELYLKSLGWERLVGWATVKALVGGRVHNGADEMHYFNLLYLDTNSVTFSYKSSFDRFIVVAHKTQIPRLRIHALAFNFFPEFLTVDTNNNFHGGIAEKFLQFYTLHWDQNWQETCCNHQFLTC